MHIGVTAWYLGDQLDAAHLTAQAVTAERLGLESFWLPESHFTGEGSIPAPLMLLASVAAATGHIRLGTSSYLLPIRHPLHAAAEVAVLDRLCGGRLILGLGRGFRDDTFHAFNVPVAEKRRLFAAHLQTMRRAWAGESVVASGPAVRLAPLPVQQPHPPLWVAALGPQAIRQVASLGLPYLASPMETTAQLRDNLSRYRDILEECNLPDPGILPVMRTIHASHDPALLTQVRDLLEKQGGLRHPPGTRADDWAMIGTPLQVADRLEALGAELGLTHLIARGRLPGLTQPQQQASLEALAEVAALLRQRRKTTESP